VHSSTVLQIVEVMAQDTAHDVHKRAWFAKEVQEVRKLSRGNAHSKGRDQIQRGLQNVYTLAQLAAIKGGGAYRSISQGRAWSVTVKIGYRRSIDELDIRLSLEEVDHSRTLHQERLDQFFVVGLTQFVTKVRTGRVSIIDAFGARQGIVRNPQPTARPSACSADLRILFDDYHLAAKASRGYRCGQSPRP
jgi:hypothetical protein